MAQLLSSKYIVKGDVIRPFSSENRNSGTKSHENEKRVGLTHATITKNKPILQPRTIQNWSEKVSTQVERISRDEDDPHGVEGFPQYCMTCEKQFPLKSCSKYLYCSEACRKEDHEFDSALPTVKTNYSLRYSSLTARHYQHQNALNKISSLSKS